MSKNYAVTNILVILSFFVVATLVGCEGTTTHQNYYNSNYPIGWNRAQYGYYVVGSPYYYSAHYPYYYSSHYNYPSYYVSPWAYGSYHTYYPNNASTSGYHAPYTIYPNYSPYAKFRTYNYPVASPKTGGSPAVTPYYYSGYRHGYPY